MRTSYFRKRSGLLSPTAGVVAFVAGAIVVIILVLRFALPGVFFTVTAPFFALAPGNGIFAGFQNAARLQQEVDMLTAENRALQNQALVLETRIKDLERLAGPDNAGVGVAAGVMARPPLSPYDVLIVVPELSAGERIAEGDQVTADGGIPIGTVSSLEGSRAHVSLFSASGRVTEVWAGESRLPLSLTGRGAGAFSADMARDSGVVEGDLVYAPGPGALPMGRVVRVVEDASSPRAQVHVQSLVNPFTLTWVSISAL